MSDEEIVEKLRSRASEMTNTEVAEMICRCVKFSLKLELYKEYIERIEKGYIIGFIKEYGEKALEILLESIPKKTKDTFDSSPIGLPKEMTIGLELEFGGKGALLLKHCSYDEIIQKLDLFSDRFEEIISEWELKNEYTVKLGKELTSPKLKDTEECWQSVDEICWFLQSIECEINENCGGHIHIGANILGCDDNMWQNLFVIWNEAEEIIYKMSNAENDVIRENALSEDFMWAGSTSDRLQEILDNGNVHVNCEHDLYMLAKLWEDRDKSINLSNLGVGDCIYNTIEFRLPNGTIDAKTLKENVTLYGSILAICVARGKTPEYKQEIFEHFSNRKIPEEEKAQAFMDLLFDDEETKQIFMRRFYSVKDEKIYENIASTIPKFVRKLDEGRDEK